MELKIDNISCDLNLDTDLELHFPPLKVKSIEELRSGWSTKLSLPSTPTNDLILCHSHSLHIAEEFNNEIHTATILCNGEFIREGVVRLLKVSPLSPKECYLIEIRGGAPLWVKMACERPLKALDIEGEIVLTPTDIVSTWSDDSYLKMLPVAYDNYDSLPSESSSLVPKDKMLSCDDFHPFMSIHRLLNEIFSQAGYTLKSDFVESELFKTLYMSGAYHTSDVEARRERMDFFARRLSDVESQADYLGRVHSSIGVAANSIGNIVDSFHPTNIDSAGKPTYDCFSNGGFLSFEEGELCFRPPTTINSGFEYHLCYTTSYRILSRTRLKGFDSLYLGTGADFKMQIKNPFVDRRGNTNPGQQYLVVPFSHTDGNRYRIKCGSSLSEEYQSASFTTTLPLKESTQPELQLYDKEQMLWLPYPEDWALYDGHISYEGSIDVEINLRTAPESIGPTSPKLFNQIYFYGADPQMTLILKRESWLRPNFKTHPGFGSRVNFEDIANHNIRQCTLIDALIQMFNLRIFTNEQTKVVYIEPEQEFYDDSQVVDLFERQLTKPLEIQLWDNTQFESRRYGYLEGEGEVSRLNNQSAVSFGDWIAHSSSKATKTGEESIINPLFSPTLNISNYAPTAPSALIPSVGDRDIKESISSGEFTPRIVRYMGLKPLPEGEHLNYPAPERLYPFAAFHFAGDDYTPPFSLCFENRDNVEGLNRYYTSWESTLNRAKRLLVALHIKDSDMNSLSKLATDESWGINSLFRVRLDGEPIRCRLDSIDSYNPQNQIAHLSLLIINDDKP